MLTTIGCPVRQCASRWQCGLRVLFKRIPQVPKLYKIRPNALHVLQNETNAVVLE